MFSTLPESDLIVLFDTPPVASPSRPSDPNRTRWHQGPATGRLPPLAITTSTAVGNQFRRQQPIRYCGVDLKPIASISLDSQIMVEVEHSGIPSKMSISINSKAKLESPTIQGAVGEPRFVVAEQLRDWWGSSNNLPILITLPDPVHCEERQRLISLQVAVVAGHTVTDEAVAEPKSEGGRAARQEAMKQTRRVCRETLADLNQVSHFV
jgi:hypothetical protein